MKIIIAGCGRMGSELAGRLSEAHEITVIDRDPRALTRLGPGFRGRTVEGVSFDRDVLLAAGVESSDALAAVTSGDNANIVTARVARTVFRVPSVVARVCDPRRAKIYRRLGLPTVSTTAWGVARMTQLLAHRELNVIRSLGEGEVELVEQEVPAHWVGRPASQVSVAGEIEVTALLRRGTARLPAAGTLFERGDRAVITVLSAARTRLEHLLGLR